MLMDVSDGAVTVVASTLWNSLLSWLIITSSSAEPRGLSKILPHHLRLLDNVYRYSQSNKIATSIIKHRLIYLPEQNRKQREPWLWALHQPDPQWEVFCLECCCNRDALLAHHLLPSKVHPNFASCQKGASLFCILVLILAYQSCSLIKQVTLYCQW